MKANNALWVVVVVVLVVTAFSVSASFMSPKARVNQQAKDIIMVANPVDAPLLIELTELVTVQGGAVSGSISAIATVNLKAVGSKPINAFAIGRGSKPVNVSDADIRITNCLSADCILQPGQFKTTSVEVITNDSSKKILLFIDFVEFTDGTTWGSNDSQAVEHLSGQREGAKAALKQIKELLKTRDRASLISNLSDDNLNALTSKVSEHSERWREGFEMGAAITRNRLKRVLQKGDDSLLNNELQQPYDALGGRQKNE